MVVVGIFLLGGTVYGLQSSGLTGASITGAFSFGSLSSLFGTTTYDCGDDYPITATPKFIKFAVNYG